MPGSVEEHGYRGNGLCGADQKQHKCYPGGASKHSSNPDADLPLSVALDSPNIHHFLVAGQSARPVDAAGNPLSASYVYATGNLVLNMIYNLMLEATGRLQKCRLYEMSNN